MTEFLLEANVHLTKSIELVDKIVTALDGLSYYDERELEAALIHLRRTKRLLQDLYIHAEEHETV